MEKLKEFVFEKFSEKSISKELAAELLMEIKDQESRQPGRKEIQDIAVVGMACRMPETKTPEELWEHLVNKKDFIRKFPEERKRDILDFKPGLAEELADFNLIDGGFLERIDLFDPEFFNISPAEARMMDPLQRIFLEVTSEALERSGYSKSSVDGSKVGIYMGYAETEYGNLLRSEEPSALPGNLPAVIASRISYLLNLKGPTLLVDTTCSSSLVALHLACEGLRNSDCDIAVVGGIHIIYYPAQKGTAGDSVGILSKDYRTRAFDAKANGTGMGEGAVSIVIKSLEAAVKDRDQILAVIKGIAVNSDGRSNGITAPNADAQTEVIMEAWRRAGINPEELSYIEAHGTGTKLGDPIEFEGLNKAFQIHTDKKQFCGIGSLKSNTGHLDTAAGLAGLLKVILALNHKKIPASIHFERPNPLIDFNNSSLRVVSELQDWETINGRRIAGVSSFGLSGTNCHVVVSEYTGHEQENNLEAYEYLVTYSAKSFDDLKQIIEANLDFLSASSLSIGNISFTRNVRREHYPYRIALIVKDVKELIEGLEAFYKAGDESGIKEGPGNVRILYGVVKDDYTGQDEIKKYGSVTELAEAYVNGYKIRWKLFYDDSVRTADMPVYPLKPKRYWVTPDGKPQIDAAKLKNTPAEGTGQNINDVVKEIFDYGEFLISDIDFNPASGYEKDMEEFCVQIIMQFFQSYNLLTDPGIIYSKEMMFKYAGIIPLYRKLYNFMLRNLKDAGVISMEGDSIRLVKEFVPVDLERLEESNRGKHKDVADCFSFPYYVSRSYREVLTGKKSPLSVIYPGGDLNFQYKFNKVGDKIGDIYGKLSIRAVADYVHSLKGRSIRILEVGAGMGNLTNLLLPWIKDVPCMEYYFTDIGKAFVQNAKKVYQQYPFMRYQLFDIRMPCTEQNIEPGTFNIIFAFNVVHTCENIKETLRYLKEALKPDGALFMMESAKNEAWSTLAWGVLEGWWVFEDYDIRPEEPMLTLPQWESVVLDSRYDFVYTFPVSPERRKQTEKSLIIAKKSASEAEILEAEKRVSQSPLRVSPAESSEAFTEDGNSTEEKYIAPADSNEIESIIYKIWIEVLEYESIGLDDDFYERGGDSLLAVKMLELLKERLNVTLEIADIFAYTTISRQAKYIESLKNNTAGHNSGIKPENRQTQEAEPDGIMKLLDDLKKDQLSVDDAINILERNK